MLILYNYKPNSSCSDSFGFCLSFSSKLNLKMSKLLLLGAVITMYLTSCCVSSAVVGGEGTQGDISVAST